MSKHSHGEHSLEVSQHASANDKTKKKAMTNNAVIARMIRSHSSCRQDQYADCSAAGLAFCCLEPASHFFPVHQVPERTDVVWTAVLVVQVVCVFPNIKTQNWRAAF